MKIVLYEKDTIIVNIICITVDIIGICCVDKSWMASIFAFAFSSLLNLLYKYKLYKKNKKLKIGT